MTVRLTDDEISELERRRKIVRCVAVVCRVCGFRQHAKPGSVGGHERCLYGCTLDLDLDTQCRLCGEARTLQSKYCIPHRGSGREPFIVDDGILTTHIADTHWHAAQGAGPVSQYAVTS